MDIRVHRRIITTVAIVVLALALAACGADPATEPSGGSTGEPTGTAQPTSTPEPDALKTPVVAYFLSGEDVVPVRRTASDAAVAKAALEALVAGPSADESGGGLTSSIPEGTRLLGVSVSGSTATVDLSTEFTGGGGSLSMMTRVAQVVFTATQFDSIESVAFKVDGATLDTLGGEGIILEGPQTRADWEDYAPAILVESPVRGDTVPLSGSLRVLGSANVYEAEFRIEITDGDGLIIADESVMATSGSGTRGTFDATLELEPGKTGLGSIVVFYDSPKDGSRVVVDEVPLRFE